MTRFDGINRFDGTTKTQPEPFDATPAGIVKNTITGLPQAAVQVGKDILQSTARSIFGTGLSIGNVINKILGRDIVTSYQPTGGFEKSILGEGETKDLATNVLDVQRSIEDSPIARKYGLDKYSLPLAFGGVIGSTALDLTPFGGLEKNAAKALLKETTAEGATKILKTLKVPEEIATSFAPRFAESKTDEEVSQLFDLMKSAAGTKDIAAKASERAALESTPTIKTAALSPEEGQVITQAVKELPLPVKAKVNIVDYLRTPELVLKKIGLGKEAEGMRIAFDEYRAQLPKEIEKLVAWKNAVKDVPNASENIFKFLEGKDIKLSEGEAKVAGEVKQYLKEWADKLGLPEDKRISHYITHIFPKGKIEKEFDPDLARIITDRVPGSVYDPFLEKRLGKLGFKEDVFAALDAYVKRATRKVNLDSALEALQKASKNLDVESYKYIARYAARVNMRPTELDTLFDNAIKSVFGYRFGGRPTTAISQAWRRIVYRGTLGLNIGSAVRNLTQGVNTYAKLGEKWTVIGYSKALLNLVKDGMKELKEVGVLADEFIQDKKLGVYKNTLQKMDSGLFAFFEMAEKINRGAAYFGAKSKYLAKGLSEKEAINQAKKLVRDTQFAFGSIDTPVGMASDIVRTITQLQTYNVKQIEFLTNMAKNKEFLGLFRYIGGSVAMLYSIGKLLGMSPKDLIPTVRLGGTPTGNILTGAGTLATTKSEQEKEAAKKKLISSAFTVIPGGVQIRKTIQGLSTVGKGKSTTAKGRTRFDVEQTPENFVRAGVFGPSTLPEAQEYYRGSSTKKKTRGKI